MASFFRHQPLFVLLIGLTSIAMFLPMLFALRLENWAISRNFFYTAVILLIVTGLLMIALSGRRLTNQSASRLLDVASAFLLLPALMAIPVWFTIPQLTFFSAYFEMLSSFTTTGASILSEFAVVPDSIHLWRAFVAWLGGFLMLVVALAVFMPINLGGFELYARSRAATASNNTVRRADIRARLIRYSTTIFPVYLMLTSILALLLIAAGDRLLDAVIHAMSTLSTSGISAGRGTQEAGSGILGEVFIFCFLLAAVSRHFLLQDSEGRAFKALKSDKEINLMLVIVTVLPLALFLRHWSGAADFGETSLTEEGLMALWGGAFTVLSFLTTTGFESASWVTARNWSGLNTPAILLMGLASIGGGIATTAGGIKLLRIYALYKHGLREMQRLRYPNSVAGAGKRARNIRREGAYVAWIFFMLYMISLAAALLAVSVTGVDFEDSLVLSVAALSNTGPLLAIGSDTGLTYATLPDTTKAILCAVMILGRMEALALIAIFNPNYWRK